MPLTPQQLLLESQARRSYRQFLPDAVDMSTIEQCILTAGTAPSGAGLQPWHFVVISDTEVKRQLRTKCEDIEREFYSCKITKQWQSHLDKLHVDTTKAFLTEAPVLIVVFKVMYNTDSAGNTTPNYYVGESVGIATGLLINALRNAGLATLTYTPAPMGFLTDFCHRPQGETAMMILAVGKADSSYSLPNIARKQLTDISSTLSVADI